MDSRSPALGAKVVARAWADPAFKKLLLKDTRAALMQMGIDIGAAPEFSTVENTPQVHNVIVCTLCSCYPKMLLGIPPAWYKSLAYRSRTVVDPRGVLAEFGVEVPKDVKVRVHDSTADLRYIVLPMRPKGTKGWSEEQLAAIVTRDCMIGTALPQVPPSEPRPEPLGCIREVGGLRRCCGVGRRSRRAPARADPPELIEMVHQLGFAFPDLVRRPLALLPHVGVDRQRRCLRP